MLKRIISLVAVAVISFVTMLIGQIQEHPALIYIGVIIGGFLGLYLAVYLFKFLCKIVGQAVSSILFVLAAGVVGYTLVYHDVISPIVSYFAGCGVGLLFMLLIARSLAKKAHTSTVVGELFGFITGYQLKAFISRDTVISKDDKDIDNNDKSNIILVLNQQFGLTKKEAKTAADYAVNTVAINAPFDDKVKTALQYQGSLN